MENQQIAMTSPVIMEMGEKSSMSFVMPEEHAIENLPGIVFGKVKIFLDTKLFFLHSRLFEDIATN